MTFKNKIIIDDGSNGHLFLNNTSSENTIHSGTTGFAAYKNLVINAAEHIFKISNTEKIKIDSSGRLLVGSAAIQYADSPLYVSSTGPVQGAFHSSSGGTNDQARISLGALANNPPYNRGVYLTAENNGAGHDFIVACSASHAAGPTEKIRIKSDGKIGVNTDTPIGTLDVYDGTFVLSKPNASGGERNWRFVNNNVAAGNLGLQVSTAAGGSTFQNVVEIKRTGVIGLNNDDPGGSGLDIQTSRTRTFSDKESLRLTFL